MKLAQLAATAALLMLGTVTLATPAQAQSAAANGATGRTVISVSFAQGQFRREADGSWVELDARGNVAFRFRETGRDDWSVYLQKQGAPHEVQLDLWRGMITLSVSGGPRQDLYEITGAQAPRLPAGTRPVLVPATGGLTLRRVAFADGYFQQTANGQWTEYNAQGRAVYFFREQSRTADTVVIFDASRNTGVQFNLTRRMILISFSGARYEDLYPITATQNDGGASTPTRPGTVPPTSQLPPVNLPRPLAPDYGRQATFFVEAGPLTSQREAEINCPALGERLDGAWTGGWQRRDGRLSVCEFRFDRRNDGRGGRGDDRGGGGRGDDRGGPGGSGGYGGVTREFEVGPIWNQSDAENKCRGKASELRGEWTGQWRTTESGRMSVCEIRLR
ncbi:MAG: mannan-binding lectin [Sphingomonas sp.]